MAVLVVDDPPVDVVEVAASDPKLIFGMNMEMGRGSGEGAVVLVGEEGDVDVLPNENVKNCCPNVLLLLLLLLLLSLLLLLPKIDKEDDVEEPDEKDEEIEEEEEEVDEASEKVGMVKG